MTTSSIKHMLERPGVHCSDPVNVLSKISRIQKDGPRKLQVFSDFDHTLTCHRLNGMEGCTSYGVIETSTILPLEYRQKTAELKDLYMPIEISHNTPKQEKCKAMEKWYSRSHALLIYYKCSKTMLSEMVQSANIAFRDGHKEFFSVLHESDIPLVIFSAGVGDVITETLVQKSSYLQNIEIVSNMMQFDSKGVLIGFCEPVVHSYNKGVTALAKMNHLNDKLQGRHNVILLGDSQGDPFMVDELSSNLSNVLRIGFLNSNSMELLSLYTKLYDIVLNGGNDTLLLPNTIIELVTQSTEPC